MHMVIRAIVFAEDPDAALASARGVFDELTGDGKPFDYYTTFEEDKSTVSGQARWGKLPWAALVNSEAGQQLLREGMDATRRDFQENLDEVRQLLATRTDQELYDENSWRLYRASYLTRDAGSSVWVYGPDGDPIANKDGLYRTLMGDIPAGWYTFAGFADRTLKPPAVQAWIVPADVHF